MERIQKVVDYNSLISRFPSMGNAFVKKIDDLGDIYYKFDSVKNDVNGDYGKIVTDFVIPDEIASGITDTTDIYVNIPVSYNENLIFSDGLSDYEFYGDYYDISNKNISSFNRIKLFLNNSKKISYYFIEENDIKYYTISKETEYKDLEYAKPLKILSYYTLHTWYTFFKEYKNELTISGMNRMEYSNLVEKAKKEYGIDETDASLETYKKKDELFISRGGNNLYDWMKKYIFVEYKTEYKNEETSSYTQINGEDVPFVMTYPQITEWKKWFSRYGNDYGFYKKTCDEITDISYIDKNIYLKSYTRTKVSCLYREYAKRGGDIMYDWLNNIIFEELPKKYQLNDSTFHIPTLIYNEIYNLGEETPLSEEWSPGRKYNKGNIFTYSDNCYQLSGDGGYSYDSCYNEYSIKDSFNRLNSDSGNMTIDFNYYSYNEENKFIKNPSRERMGNKCEIYSGLVFYIQGNIYSSFTIDYIEIPNQITNDIDYVRVNYYSNGIPFAYYNGHTYMGKNGKISYRKNNCGDLISFDINKNGIFMLYNENYIKVNTEDNSVIIKNDKTNDSYLNDTYFGYDSYFYYNYSPYFIKGDTVAFNESWIKLKDDEFKEIKDLENTSFFINDLGTYCWVINPYKVYDIKIGSGTTSSKLDTFYQLNKLCDMNGNIMNGVFSGSTEKTYPNENEILGFGISKYYVSNVEPTEDTYSIEMGNPLQKTNCYYLFGNIITDIKYFYQSGNSDTDLAEIKESDIYDSNMWESGFPIYATFEYVMGGIIKMINENGNYHYEWIGNDITEKENKDYNLGVKYKEQRELTLQSEKYFINNLDYEIIRYINIEGEQLSAVANFTYVKKINEVNGINYSEFDYGYINSPTFREEYNIGNFGLKKVESDIYMDRGNSSSFAKHFAIGECLTLESLSQYQNGGVKIINNGE